MRRLRLAAPILVATGSSATMLLLWAGPAAADGVQLQSQGWWTVTNPGKGVVPPAPPDVPAKGLLVESELNGSPGAYAGLVFELPQDATASTLNLTIAPRSATTPDAKLEVCPLVDPTVDSEQGGPIADGPSYDCSNPITATANSAGTTYQFDVSQLSSSAVLAVAILPTSATDRVVFDQPESSWLTVKQSTQAAESPVSSTASGSPPDNSSSGSNPAFGGNTTSFGGSPVSPMSFPTTAPAAAQSPATSPTTVPQAGSSPGRQSLPTFGSFSTASGAATPLAVGLVVAGLLGGAFFWFYAGRRRPDEVTA